MKPEFERLAESYRKFRIGYSPQTIEALSRESAGDTLDAAIGTGLLAELLRPHVRRVVGIDISRAMISKTRPPVVVAAAEHLPLRGGSFDMITCAEAYHWFDRPRAMVEFRRVLRPGGLIALIWKSPADGEPYRPLSHDLFQEITGRPYRSAMPPEVLEEMVAGWDSERFEWEVEWTVDHYVGCLSSWEAMRQQLGPLREQFLDSFRSRLDQLVGGRPFRERIVDKVYTMRV
jgi:SAM-dependent methyltransferase